VIRKLKKYEILLPIFLLVAEFQLLFPLVKTLFQMLSVANSWPHLVADSAVFLEQPGLNKGLEGWRALLLPVNEHRMLLSRFVAELPRLFNEPLAAWNVAFSILLLVASLFAFERCLYYINKKASALERLVVFFAGSILILNPWQAENLIWDINLTWFLQNFLILVSVSIMLPIPHRFPVWFDIFLPPLAILNGGQGYSVLLSVGIFRFLLFERKWLLPLVSLLFFLLNSLLPLGLTQSSLWGFNYKFQAIMLNNWWPASGLWSIVWICLILIQIQFIKDRITSEQWKQLCICSVPFVYGLLFSLSVNLSRSSLGLKMAERESYITPLTMVGMGLILTVWLIADIRKSLAFTYMQIFSLLLPVFVLIPILEAGFTRPSFFQQQRRMLDEQDRRITWFHCRNFEKSITPSNCMLTPVYDKWDIIRRSFAKDNFNPIFAGNKAASDAKLFFLKQRTADLRRVYLIRHNSRYGKLIFYRKSIIPIAGDQLFELKPESDPVFFKVVD
jgi:hypothetical protein